MFYAIYMATRPRGFALVLVPVYYKTLGLMLYLLHACIPLGIRSTKVSQSSCHNSSPIRRSSVNPVERTCRYCLIHQHLYLPITYWSGDGSLGEGPPPPILSADDHPVIDGQYALTKLCPGCLGENLNLSAQWTGHICGIGCQVGMATTLFFSVEYWPVWLHTTCDRLSNYIVRLN